MVVPNNDLATQPDAMSIDFSNDQSDKSTEQVVAWPGSLSTWGLTGQQLVDACTRDGMVSGTVRRTLATTAGHGLLVVTDQGLAACSSNGMTVAGEHGVVSVAVRTNGPGSTSVLGGKLPAGVTRVSVRTPRGVQRATIVDGYWVVEDQVTLGQSLLEPQKLLVTMSGSKPRSFWHEWVTLDAKSRALQATSLPSLYTDSELDRTCAQAVSGTVVARSLPGHAVYISGTTDTVCVAGSGSTYTHPAGAAERTKDAFTPLASFDDNGPGVFSGGGLLPSGVTSVVFHTRDGDIPAAISNGRWLHEQQMVVFDDAAGPTSVTLSGPGGTKTITLG